MIKKSKTRERSATSTKVRSVPAGSPAARTASAVVGAGTWLARHTPQPQELGCSSGCFRSYEGAQSRGPSRPLQAIVLQSQKMLCCQPDPDNVEPSVPVRWLVGQRSLVQREPAGCATTGVALKGQTLKFVLMC